MFQYFIIILVLIGTSHSDDPEMNEMVLTVDQLKILTGEFDENQLEDGAQHVYSDIRMDHRWINQAFSPPYAVPFEFDTENNTFNDTYQRKIYDAIDFINNNLCGCILLRYILKLGI